MRLHDFVSDCLAMSPLLFMTFLGSCASSEGPPRPVVVGRDDIHGTVARPLLHMFDGRPRRFGVLSVRNRERVSSSAIMTPTSITPASRLLWRRVTSIASKSLRDETWTSIPSFAPRELFLVQSIPPVEAVEVADRRIWWEGRTWRGMDVAD